MTSLDPSHLPHQGTAIVRTRSGSGSFPHISTIPDLRFEQSYLKSIAPYLRTRTIATDAGEHEAVEIVSVQWGNVLWITARDQIISPLLQGTIWWVAKVHFALVFHTHITAGDSPASSFVCYSRMLGHFLGLLVGLVFLADPRAMGH